MLLSIINGIHHELCHGRPVAYVSLCCQPTGEFLLSATWGRLSGSSSNRPRGLNRPRTPFDSSRPPSPYGLGKVAWTVVLG